MNNDIQGGKNADITTVWFNPKHLENITKITPDYEIGGLMGLLELLETL